MLALASLSRPTYTLAGASVRGNEFPTRLPAHWGTSSSCSQFLALGLARLQRFLAASAGIPLIVVSTLLSFGPLTVAVVYCFPVVRLWLWRRSWRRCLAVFVGSVRVVAVHCVFRRCSILSDRRLLDKDGKMTLCPHAYGGTSGME